MYLHLSQVSMKLSGLKTVERKNDLHPMCIDLLLEKYDNIGFESTSTQR